MANKPIIMSKLKTVIRLHLEGKGKKFIAQYLNLSKNQSQVRNRQEEIGVEFCQFQFFEFKPSNGHRKSPKNVQKPQ
jgi:hypothetical protein